MVRDDRGTYLVTIEGSNDVIATVSPQNVSDLRWHHLVSGRFGLVSELAAAQAAILDLEQARTD
jgi:hypothetical protein